MKQSHYNTTMTVIRYSILSFAAFISLFPFIWMLIAATNSNVAINSGSMMIGSELGNNLTKLLVLLRLFLTQLLLPSLLLFLPY